MSYDPLETVKKITADQRVSAFLIGAVKDRDVCLPIAGEDLNGQNRWGGDERFGSAFPHVVRCATLYVDNLQPGDGHTGHCETCCESWYVIRFDARCTCGYTVPLMWTCPIFEVAMVFDAMAEIGAEGGGTDG